MTFETKARIFLGGIVFLLVLWKYSIWLVGDVYQRGLKDGYVHGAEVQRAIYAENHAVKAPWEKAP